MEYTEKITMCQQCSEKFRFRSQYCFIIMGQREENVQGQAAYRSNTVKLRIEAPGLYAEPGFCQYKWIRPTACLQGPASIRSFTVCDILLLPKPTSVHVVSVA